MESATADNYTYSYTFASDTPIALQIMPDIDNITHDFEENVSYWTLENADQAQIINLKNDINN